MQEYIRFYFFDNERGGPVLTLMITERLPDTGPEDVAVVHVHHDPLSIEWILVNGAS